MNRYACGPGMPEYYVFLGPLENIVKAQFYYVYYYVLYYVYHYAFTMLFTMFISCDPHGFARLPMEFRSETLDV